MNTLAQLLWLDKIEKDMMNPMNPNAFVDNLYKKGSWWQTAHEKAMSELSDADIIEYNKRSEVP